MKHKLLVVLSIVMVLAMVLTGCQPTSTPNTATAAPKGGATTAATSSIVYKIAIVVPLSGDVKTFGESTRDGAMMAIEEARAAGMNIDIVLADSKCDAQEATNAANKVITQDKVHYIIGEVCTGATLPITTLAEQYKILQITPTSTNPAVTVNEDGSVKKYVFRACFLDPFQGEAMASIALDLGAKTAAILYDVGSDYVKGLAEYSKAAFEKKGGKVLVFEAYTKADTDFSALLGKVADAKVDVLFLPDYYPKVNLIAQQVKEKGITATMIGGDGWDSSELNLTLLEGGYFANHYSPDDPRPVVADFVKAYQAKYGNVPDALATLAYDAAKILLQSIQEAGKDDPTLAAEKMAAIKYTGVSGDISFDAQHNPQKKAVILKVTGGKVVYQRDYNP